MKTTLYIIRHAEAEGNVFRRIHGQYDSLLTANGLKQVEALRERFRGIPVDVCYSSDLIRARTTAQAVYLDKGLPLYLDRRLREVDLGVWEDVPFGELYLREAEQLRRFNDDPDSWRVEGAETYAAYATRFLAEVEAIAKRHPGQTVALFSHGSVIRSMQHRLFPEMLGYSDNTAVSLLEYEDGVFRPVFLNDGRHLNEEISTLARQNWWRGGTDYNLWFRPPLDGDHLDGHFEVLLEEEPIGRVELDLQEGLVTEFYLRPAFRGRGLGEQLLGQAVSAMRRLGRTSLQIPIPPDCVALAALCHRHGLRGLGAGREGAAVWRLDFRPDRDLAPEQDVAVTAL